LSQALETSRAFVRNLDAGSMSDPEAMRPFDMVILHGGAAVQAVPHWNKPILLIGSREVLLRFNPQPPGNVADFLFTPWTADEAVLRSYLVITRAAQTRRITHAEAAAETSRVVIADDDSTMRALVEATVQNSGLECRSATNGGEALELVRSWHANAAVLDVNMPDLNGF